MKKEDKANVNLILVAIFVSHRKKSSHTRNHDEVMSFQNGFSSEMTELSLDFLTK